MYNTNKLLNIIYMFNFLLPNPFIQPIDIDKCLQDIESYFEKNIWRLVILSLD